MPYDRFKEGNPEYDRYIHSSAWRKKADERMKLDGGICRVCGKPATEVHHLTYDNFRNEKPEELVSLCRCCHNKAEEFYDPAKIPWAMDEIKPEGNNFMAAMRTDACKLASMVLDYINKARGISFEALMSLRQPTDIDGKKYWTTLRDAVTALCYKRYSRNCAGDRMDMMTGTIANRVQSVCLSQIEHALRNEVQSHLHDIVMTEYAVLEKWKDVAQELGITNGTLSTLRKDDGSSFGPSLREAVMHYCALDAAAGIKPVEGFECLKPEDYERLNGFAEYVKSISGDGAFRGEFGGKQNA